MTEKDILLTVVTATFKSSCLSQVLQVVMQQKDENND